MEKLPLNRKKPQSRSLLRLTSQRQREKELFLRLTILLLLHVIFFELWGELQTTVFGTFKYYDLCLHLYITFIL